MEEKEKSFREFLWTLSGFKRDIVSTCKVDGFHASIIGVLLLIVGIYATLAWSFFFQTVTTNPVVPIIAGLFMGFYLISFDRALIASMSGGKVSFFSLAFRFLLATLLGIFLAQPMILKFYEKDISREAQILVDKKNQERKKELEVQYKPELQELTKQKADLEQYLSDQSKLLNQAESDFKVEMDGTGGTGKLGYKTIAMLKEKIYQKHQEEYQQTASSVQPILNDVQKRINEINDKVTKDFEEFKQRNTSFGTLVQAEALASLLKKDKTGNLRLRYYLLALILTLIELSALIAKMLFSTKSYRSKVDFYTQEEVMTSRNNKEISLEKLEVYKDLTKENELEIIQRFFNETKGVNNAKLEEMIAEWRKNSEMTYKELWELFRTKFIIHE